MAAASRETRPGAPEPRRILHVLAVSVPHVDGYTMRSQGIVRCQQAHPDFEPVVVTSPFYPGSAASVRDERIEGVPFFRVAHPSDEPGSRDLGSRLCRAVHSARRPEVERRRGPSRGGPAPVVLNGLSEMLLLRRFQQRVERIAREVQPHVIHAHSPYRCGVPAAAVAARLRIPLVYEVRGLWEESNVAEGRFARDSVKYRFWRRKEDQVLAQADVIVCICDGLAEEMERRGIPSRRLVVVPNGVDPADFAPGGGVPPAPVRAMAQRLRGPRLGYIGSLRRLEGLDVLIRAAARLKEQGHESSVLIVGDGPERESLQQLAAELGLHDRVAFTGSVPHEQVQHYYRLIDCFVVARRASRVTRLVTPLKPLEAMTTGCPVIAPDLPALREIVGHGRTGLLYAPGDPAALAGTCARLLEDPTLRCRLGSAAAEWVRRHRTWSHSMRRLAEAYHRAQTPAASAGRA